MSNNEVSFYVVVTIVAATFIGMFAAFFLTMWKFS
jgi:hypothetical protein